MTMKKFNTIMTTLFFTSFSDIAMRVARKKISLNHVWFVIMLMLVNIGSLYAQPTITSISPTSGLPGTTVTMTGTNLNAVTSVRMFGSSGTPIVVLSSSATSLVVGIPHSATGSGTFYVENGGGNTASPTYTVNAIATYPTAYGSGARRVLGQGGYGSSNVFTGLTQSRMNNPQGVFIDRVSGKVFVADAGNNRVLRYASYSSLADGGLAEAVFGQSAFNGSSTGGGAMKTPQGIYVDSQGNLWVADADQHRILRFPNATTTTGNAGAITTGSNNAFILGQTALTNFSSGTAQNQFNFPSGVFVDEPTGTLWVSEVGNNRVLRFDNIYATFTSQFQRIEADAVLGQPNFTSGNPNAGGVASASTLRSPYSLWGDPNGLLFVPEGGNHRIVWFNNARTKATGSSADGVLGQTSFTAVAANGGGAISANTFDLPGYIFVDPNGRLWVSDLNNKRILRFSNPSNSVNNNVNADIVLGQASYTTNAVGDASSNFSRAEGVGLDGAGRVYVSDAGNHRVLIFDTPQPPTITSISPTTASVQSAFTLTLTGTDINSPTTLTLQSTSLLPFVTSSSATQIVVNVPASAVVNAGAYTITITTAGGTTTSSITLTALSNATYSATTTAPVSSIATLVLGQSTFTGTESSNSQNGLGQPTYTTVAPSGKVFVADYGNHRVLRYASFASLSNGVNAEMVFGQGTYAGNNSATTQTGMNQPYQLFVDENDMLWVADQLNHRVLRFDNASTVTFSSGNPPQAAQVLGQAGFNTSNTATTQSGMNSPSGVWAVGSGSAKRLFVADKNNNRVLRFDNVMAKGNGGSADVVLGQSAFNTNATGTGAGQMNTPIGVMVDASGTLWVTENVNKRVNGFDNATALSSGASATR